MIQLDTPQFSIPMTESKPGPPRNKLTTITAPKHKKMIKQSTNIDLQLKWCANCFFCGRMYRRSSYMSCSRSCAGSRNELLFMLTWNLSSTMFLSSIKLRARILFRSLRLPVLHKGSISDSIRFFSSKDSFYAFPNMLIADRINSKVGRMILSIGGSIFVRSTLTIEPAHRRGNRIEDNP